LKDMQVSNKEKEVVLQSKEDHIKKLQGQLYQVKKNDEYKALENEIVSNKADNSIIEEEILILLDSIDEKRQEVQIKRQDVADFESKLKAKELEVKERVSQLDNEIESLSQGRSEIAALIDKEVVSVYDRIIQSKKAQLALVSIKDSACQGCFMHVRPQLINEVMLGKNLVFCENCARILYVDEES
ncbi:MAG: C4-type zinc ribbon domain-containing protein, partial [Candidatus Kappaea frigidicola]|nr:C4-type zinc ribbon domain-containing protein [Candidatus Kappaea frigidicola]